MASVEQRPGYRIKALCAGCGKTYTSHWQYEIAYCLQAAGDRGWRMDAVEAEGGSTYDLCKDCSVPGRSV